MNHNAGSLLRQFGPMVYLPTLLFSLGEGAVIPLIPVLAIQMGASVAEAALITSALVIGQLSGNIPAGWTVSRIGERYTMVIAGVAGVIAALIMAFSSGRLMLALAVFTLGFAAAIFGLARQAFIITRIEVRYRARALSLLGGSFRLGIFVGPFLTAAILALLGEGSLAIVFFAICALMLGLIALVLIAPDPEKIYAPLVSDRLAGDAADSGEPVDSSTPASAGVFATMWQHRGVLVRLGTSAALLSAGRSARQVVLPLWGLALGLDAQTIAAVMGFAGAIDFALFYASGQVMDRFGRLAAALPAMLLMSAGFIGLAFITTSDTALLWFGMFAGILSVGNGLSNGILMTMGADVAPQQEPATFLGSWRTLTDAGGAAAPLILSGLVALFSLPLATGAMGLMTLLGAAGFIRWIPRYIPHPRKEENSSD